MKSLYITFLNEDIRPGYRIKIHSQCKAFAELGYESYLYVVKKYGMALYQINEDSEQIIKTFENKRKRVSDERNIYDEFFLLFEFISQITRIIEDIKPEVVYIRRIVPLNPLVIRLLKKLKKHNIKIIYEYPTFPWESEMRKNKQYLFLFLDKCFYNRLIKFVDLFTCGGQCNGKKYITIINGVDVDNYKLHQKRNEKDIILIGVAHVAYYHGYDRVIKGLKSYYESNPTREVIFHIVGPIEKTLGLEELVEQYDLKDKVLFHGFKTGNELDEIFEISDIGIECLAVFRREKGKSASLKSREYMARGIPFLYAGEMDFETKVLDFVFEEEENEEGINISRLLSEYDAMQSKPEDIRNFAKLHFSWKKQIKNVLNALEELS